MAIVLVSKCPPVVAATMSNALRPAIIVSVVIDGWHKGKLVTGEFSQITCDHDGITTDCFVGSLRLGQGGD